MDGLLHLIELVAASWYIAYVLTNKGGPLNLFARAREAGGGRWHGRIDSKAIAYTNPVTKEIDFTTTQTEVPGLMDCIVCMLPYVALILWLIDSPYLTIPFAIAGLGLWAHSYTGWIHFGGK